MKEELLAELKRIVALLPGPVWNEHRVLVWSLSDVDRIEHLIAKAEGQP